MLDYLWIAIFTITYVSVVYNYLLFTYTRDTIAKELNCIEVSAFMNNYVFYDVMGQIVASFIWPKINQKLKEKYLIAFSVLNQSVIFFILSKTININSIYFFRFLSGMGQNLSSIGKSYTFKIS